MKKGLVFDLDGVITDTAHYHFLAWQALANKLGIMIDENFNESLKGIERLASLERILAHGGKEKLYSIDEKQLLAAEKNEQYLTLLANLGPKDLLPGVKAFLKEAKELKLPCAIASASKNAPLILEKLGITDYFAVIVDPAKLTNGKPAPEIFLTATAALQLTPDDVIGFEDAQAGVEALNRAGIMAIGIDPENTLTGTVLNAPNFESLKAFQLINFTNK